MQSIEDNTDENGLGAHGDRKTIVSTESTTARKSGGTPLGLE
jgi:hypothetical protein